MRKEKVKDENFQQREVFLIIVVFDDKLFEFIEIFQQILNF